ncbi:MAG: 3'-5' exonuclease domain-containing protein 2 [Bacteroidaceae bacterium]|nr:3'-5' exonuclease domain-containing protein 2 [Bacteroidaceae bacterium]
MKTIYNKFDKTKISSLPKVVFQGKIEIVSSENEAKRAVRYLLKQPVLGLDTETRPCFQHGHSNKVSLLQVCTPDICFLFRLNHIDMPACILRLLTDKKVLKIGLSWKDDLTMLRRRKDFQPGEFVELQEFVRRFGIEDMSLQKLYANVFQQKISKSQRMTNWDADELSEAQKKYAATDAWACIRLYAELCRMKQEGYHLIVLPEEKNELKENEETAVSKER